MRVLQLISKNDRYGAQRIFLDQVAAVRDAGHQVFVIARGNEGYVSDSVRALGIPYRGIRMKGLRDVLFLRRFVKEHRIDVIHSTLDRADHFGRIAAWLSGRPAVSTMMVPRVHPGFRFMDKIAVLSRLQKRVLEGKGIRPDRIVLIRPGVDTERFSRPDPSKRESWRKTLSPDSYTLVLCHISSMLERKAHRVSLDLLAACKDRGEKPLLIVIGDPVSGEYYESLIEHSRRSGIAENVVFTGWTADVPEILSLCHFTVLPSENEALGVVLMEGMAAGTPVIAREGEGGAELIADHGAGFLYRPQEGVSRLADQVVALKRDEARFRSLSEMCRATAKEEFSMARFGRRLDDLYRSVFPQKAGV
jgi:glycosyltransferase involved in cell wall biosynthesis